MRGIRPSLWSTRSRVAAGVFVVCVIVAGALAAAIEFTRTGVVAVLGVLVAAGSLVVVAAANYVLAQRQRQAVTMEAWIKWADGTLPLRLHLSEVLGREAITDAQAIALVDKTVLTDQNEVAVAEEVRVQLHDELSRVLNGLERLSVGVQHGTYDGRFLRSVGGTQILLVFDRFQPYIQRRRTTSATGNRQATAFSALIELSSDFRRRDLRRQTRDLDDERLARVRARRSET